MAFEDIGDILTKDRAVFHETRIVHKDVDLSAPEYAKWTDENLRVAIDLALETGVAQRLTLVSARRVKIYVIYPWPDRIGTNVFQELGPAIEGVRAQAVHGQGDGLPATVFLYTMKRKGVL